MVSIEVREEVKPLDSAMVREIEEVVLEAEREEERPVLYYTMPMPGVLYYSFYPSRRDLPR